MLKGGNSPQTSPYGLPDRPFHNCRASKSVDRQFQATSLDGYWITGIVKGSVGCSSRFDFKNTRIMSSFIDAKKKP